MNSASAECVKCATITEDNTLDRRIIAQHCDENITVAGLGDLFSYPCAASRNGFGLVA
jgi:hypothetical protein